MGLIDFHSHVLFVFIVYLRVFVCYFSLFFPTYVSMCAIVFYIFLAIWNYDGDTSYHLSLCVGDLIVIIEKLEGLFTFVSSF